MEVEQGVRESGQEAGHGVAINWRGIADGLALALLEIWGDRHTSTCQSCKVAKALLSYQGGCLASQVGRVLEDLRKKRPSTKVG